MRLVLLLTLIWEPFTRAFNPIAAISSSSTLVLFASKPAATSNSNNNIEVVQSKSVAVFGATGRTGRLVVQELLDRGVKQVVAVVRSKSKATEVFGVAPAAQNLKIVECDLTNQNSISASLKGVDVVIWCATGFSSESNLVDRFLSLVGIATKQSIDLVGLPMVAGAIEAQSRGNTDGNDALPKIVMCSSAGVTRPTWDPAKTERFPGAAGIPIVRLNPFGILDIKRESEEKLRTSNVPYCIVRPAGLNDDWPARSRPILSQGDVATGRTNRRDLALLLVDMLSEPAATGKTMEVFTLANYPKGDSLALKAALERLYLDVDTTDENKLTEEVIAATYAILQQLQPGEKQNSRALAMGQTFDQLDRGESGPFGKRGQENAFVAAPAPTNVRI